MTSPLKAQVYDAQGNELGYRRIDEAPRNINVSIRWENVQCKHIRKSSLKSLRRRPDCPTCRQEAAITAAGVVSGASKSHGSTTFLHPRPPLEALTKKVIAATNVAAALAAVEVALKEISAFQEAVLAAAERLSTAKRGASASSSIPGASAADSRRRTEHRFALLAVNATSDLCSLFEKGLPPALEEVILKSQRLTETAKNMLRQCQPISDQVREDLEEWRQKERDLAEPSNVAIFKRA